MNEGPEKHDQAMPAGAEEPGFRSIETGIYRIRPTASLVGHREYLSRMLNEGHTASVAFVLDLETHEIYLGRRHKDILYSFSLQGNAETRQFEGGWANFRVGSPLRFSPDVGIAAFKDVQPQNIQSIAEILQTYLSTVFPQWDPN